MHLFQSAFLSALSFFLMIRVIQIVFDVLSLLSYFAALLCFLLSLMFILVIHCLFGVLKAPVLTCFTLSSSYAIFLEPYILIFKQLDRPSF